MILEIKNTNSGMFTVDLNMILAFEDTGSFDFFIHFKDASGLKLKVNENEFLRIKGIWRTAKDEGNLL